MYESFFPLETKTIKVNEKKWMTTSIHNLIKERDKLLKKGDS